MRPGDEEPMRTENDIQAALTMLEARAPGPEKVLRAVRESATGRPSRRIRPGSPRLRVAVVAAVAVVAGIAVAVALPGSHPPVPPPSTAPVVPREAPGQPGTVSHAGHLPSSASVGKAMLTAFGGIDDDVLLDRMWYNDGPGHALQLAGKSWYWPLAPKPGQEAHERELSYMNPPAGPPAVQIEDTATAWIERTPNANLTGGMTMVCYPVRSEGGCGYGYTETPPGRWSKGSGVDVGDSLLGPGGPLSPAGIAQGIAQGQWRVTGRSRLDGQPVTVLAETSRGTFHPRPLYVWVNERTHLPMELDWGPGTTSREVDVFTYLPPTQANLAQLQVHIPKGFTYYQQPPRKQH
jgi:hypothetical protein